MLLTVNSCMPRNTSLVLSSAPFSSLSKCIKIALVFNSFIHTLDTSKQGLLVYAATGYIHKYPTDEDIPGCLKRQIFTCSVGASTQDVY